MTHTDAGLDALDRVRDALAPEAARLREEPRAFTWWPHAHAMRVTSSSPRPEDGATVVSVESRLIGGLEPRGSLYARLSERNAREPGLSALRIDGERGEISLRAAVVARPGDGGAAARRLAHAALLQIGESLGAADALSVELPGSTLLAETAAGGGFWPAVEQSEAWRAYASAAEGQRARLERAMARLRALSPAPWSRLTPAAHGLDAEVASGSARALLRLTVSQPHPRLGAGLVLALLPPATLEPEAARAPATAALLNEAESREWTGIDQLGGWCVHPALGLSHVVFVPAIAVEDSTLETLAWHAGTRTRWATAFAARVRELREPHRPAAARAAEPHQ